MKKLFVEDLPKIHNTDRIDWNKSQGHSVRFIFNDIQGEFEILRSYKKDNVNVIDLKYNNNIYYEFKRTRFLGCNFAVLLGIRHMMFTTEIGQCFSDDKRNYVIIDQRRSPLKKHPNWFERQVKIHCNKCGEEYWIPEQRVLNTSHSCGKCRYKPQNNNSVFYTDPWMIEYFPNKEDAKKYTHGSHKEFFFICPYCKKQRTKPMSISTLAKTHSVGCSCKWSSGRSFCERIFRCALEELGENLKYKYIQEASCKDIDWNKKYFYDFYFEKPKIIVELHGKEHYEESTGNRKNKSLRDIQENDRNKWKIAVENGIEQENYIVIDCRYSDFNFIKNNIISSILGQKLGVDFKSLDWNNVLENALKSEKLKIADWCKTNPEMSAKSIAAKYAVSIDMIREIQVDLGMYDAEKERKLGVKHQKDLYLERKKPIIEKICNIKKENPRLSCTDIGKLIQKDRHYVKRALVEGGIYDKNLEKENKYLNISKTRKNNRKDLDVIIQTKTDNPSISACEAGRKTNHSHGYILKIWREFGLIK